MQDFNTKIVQTRSHCISNDKNIDDVIKPLWDKGLSKNKIAKTFKLSLKVLNKITKTLETRNITNKKIPVFEAYCLIHEHKLTLIEAAKAVECTPQGLSRALKRENENIVLYFDIWKKDHTEWRINLRGK